MPSTTATRQSPPASGPRTRSDIPPGENISAKPQAEANRSGRYETAIDAESRKLLITFQPNTRNLLCPANRGARRYSKRSCWKPTKQIDIAGETSCSPISACGWPPMHPWFHWMGDAVPKSCLRGAIQQQNQMLQSVPCAAETLSGDRLKIMGHPWRIVWGEIHAVEESPAPPTDSSKRADS
jgi:hypothetical protein